MDHKDHTSLENVGDYQPPRYRPWSLSSLALLALSLPCGAGWGVVAFVIQWPSAWGMSPFMGLGALLNLVVAYLCLRRRYDLFLALFCYLFPVVGGILAPNFLRPHHHGTLTVCKSNLKNLATSLEMYSTDNAGRYPANLAQVTPNYLKVIPQCPSAQSDTYSAAYTCATDPDAYTMVCQGEFHWAYKYPPNYPQYSSWKGLIVPVP